MSAGNRPAIRATALDYVDGALTLDASVQVLAMPPTLNVPFGGTASLPLQISAPAPVGGVEVTLSSDDPTLVSVQTPTVTIPEGSQTANATVRGEAPGPATITGTTADFGNAQSVITTTANLNITSSAVTINGSFGTSLTVRLESGGIPIAPANELLVTLTAADPTCVAVPSGVGIPAGLVDTVFPVSYGGSASLPCNTTVAASATDIEPDTVDVTVDPVPGISVSTALTTGSGLQRFGSGGLLSSVHPGVDVVIRSTDPAVALVAPNNSTAGSDSIVIPIASGLTGFSFYAQGVEGQTGAADFVVSAPGFNPDTTAVTVVHDIVLVPRPVPGTDRHPDRRQQRDLRRTHPEPGPEPAHGHAHAQRFSGG